MLDTLKDILLHLDTSLSLIVAQMGFWAYLLLFLIVFSETGIIFMTFLPGDTLLLAIGALSAKSSVSLNIFWVNVFLVSGAILGNMLSYYIGNRYGRRIIRSGKMPFVKPENISAAEQFYQKHGGMAVILCRFFPIVRSFVPFIAGIGKMDRAKYFYFSVIGAILWISSLTLLGYFFGDLPFVKNNIGYIILFIALFPFIPILFSKLKRK
ncbi:MAG: VTT domain-containing protein [Chitinophagales bacterium]|nr:VTT domain-containing protein [Chitinophagales bacterium]